MQPSLGFRADRNWLKCYLPMVHQYSVFDEVEDVVKVGQVSYVDNLSSGGKTGK